MTPSARAAAAIDVLDQWLSGTPLEAALTRWARGARYAGSKDRAAVRDMVFDGVRQKRSRVWASGGTENGRAIFLGGLLMDGVDPETVFGAGPYGPAPLSAEERAAVRVGEPPEPHALDLPDWVWDLLQEDQGAHAGPIAKALRHRAPVGVRVNLRKASVSEVMAELEAQGIPSERHPASETALVLGSAKGLSNWPVYTEGLIELQDPGAQALADKVPLTPGARVLDYCAGGGGKALALAARHDGPILAHDSVQARLKQLAPRAARAGVAIRTVAPGQVKGTFDCVVLDVPCSGSGAWRRQPEAKWALEPGRLLELTLIQDDLLREGASHTRPGGVLAYMTCSLFACENAERVNAFLEEHPDFAMDLRWSTSPLEGTDGFYLAVLKRSALDRNTGDVLGKGQAG